MQRGRLMFQAPCTMLIASFIGFLAACDPCTAADLHVKAGAEAGNGQAQSPFGTIGAALAVAQEGDTIYVSQGTYVEQVVISKNRVKLKGGYDSKFKRGDVTNKYETIIDGQNKFRPMRVEGGETPVEKFQIDGFTIARGLADGAEGNDGKGGGVLIEGGASGKIARCRLVDNRAVDDGGAIEVNGNSNLKIDRCLFRGNSASDDGGAIRIQGSGSTTTIRNCIFDKNSGMDKYVIQAKGDTSIVHCTFVENMADSRGIIASRSKVNSANAKVTVASCIFAANRSMDDDPVLFADDDSAPGTATNCLFFNNESTGGLGFDVQIGLNGNREGDPLFVDASAGDFQLKAGSPAIDGAPSLKNVKKDFAGHPRSPTATVDADVKVDIGAFEYSSAAK